MVEPSTSNVNEATAQDTDEDQSKSIMEVEESNEAIEKSSVPTSSSTEPVITTASNVSKVREHTYLNDVRFLWVIFDPQNFNLCCWHVIRKVI